MSPHFLIVLDLGGWVLLVDPNHLRLLQPVGASEDTVMVASDRSLPSSSLPISYCPQTSVHS